MCKAIPYLHQYLHLTVGLLPAVAGGARVLPPLGQGRHRPARLGPAAAGRQGRGASVVQRGGAGGLGAGGCGLGADVAAVRPDHSQTIAASIARLASAFSRTAETYVQLDMTVLCSYTGAEKSARHDRACLTLSCLCPAGRRTSPASPCGAASASRCAKGPSSPTRTSTTRRRARRSGASWTTKSHSSRRRCDAI